MINQEKLLELIQSSNNILLIAHRRPDADTLGATGALYFYLQNIGKKVSAFCADPVTKDLELMAIAQHIETDRERILSTEYDLIVALDCGSIHLTTLENWLQSPQRKAALVNIDHHHSNNSYGDINLVNYKASSTSEVIYNFFRQARINITKPMAESMLMGIMYDTTFFTNGSTTANAIGLSADLLIKGAKIDQAARGLFKNKSLNTLKLWGLALQRLQYNKKLNCAVTMLSYQDFEQLNVFDMSTSEFINWLKNSLTDTRFMLLLIQVDKQTIKGSFRTSRNDIDVSLLASYLGGGGHPKAAAFSIQGNIEKQPNGQWQIK